jgi:hypothetical protein
MTDISVVIPTCDRPRLLVTALQSVLAQTVQPTEIVVVDNGVTCQRRRDSTLFGRNKSTSVMRAIRPPISEALLRFAVHS